MITFQWNNYTFDMVQFGCEPFQADMTGHSHAKGSYELHFVRDGQGKLTTRDAVYQLEAGTYYVTGPHVYHQQYSGPPDVMTEAYFYLQGSGEPGDNSLVNTFLDRHFFLGRAPGLWPLMEQIFEEDRVKQIGYQSAIGALMQLLLTQITRLYVPQTDTLPEAVGDLNDQRFLLIERAFIEDPEGITLGKLADRIGLCPRQTQRLLRSGYGMTFTEKKRESRTRRDARG